MTTNPFPGPESLPSTPSSFATTRSTANPSPAVSPIARAIENIAETIVDSSSSTNTVQNVATISELAGAVMTSNVLTPCQKMTFASLILCSAAIIAIAMLYVQLNNKQ